MNSATGSVTASLDRQGPSVGPADSPATAGIAGRPGDAPTVVSGAPRARVGPRTSRPARTRHSPAATVAGAPRAPYLRVRTRRDNPAQSQAGQPGGRGEATSYKPRPAGQGDVMPLRPEPRTQDQTRASVQPAGGRATHGVTPSPVLWVAALGKVYFGASDGKLYELDATEPRVEDGPARGRHGHRRRALVRPRARASRGTAAGIFYAVQVSLQ